MAIGGPQNGGYGEDEEGGGIFADINITPLTDIFLVLLIIFMVTTTAIAEAGQDKGGFKVNLPKGGKSEVGEIPRDLVVAILADGRAVVGGKVQDDAELSAPSMRRRSSTATRCSWCRQTKGYPHGRVVAVMESARAAGLSRLAIATRAEGKDDKP